MIIFKRDVGGNCEEGISFVLKTCAGLPLVLLIAGGSLKADLQSCKGDVRIAVNQFVRSLKHAVVLLTDEKLKDYGGLPEMIGSGLRRCTEWGKSDKVEEKYGRNFDIYNMFEGFCYAKANGDARDCSTAAMGPLMKDVQGR